jgi:hypothetical protein
VFATVPLEKLAEAYAWKEGHIAQVKAWREKTQSGGANMFVVV